MSSAIRRHTTDSSVRSTGSTRRSDESYNSQSTALTSFHESPRPSPRPSLQHAASAAPRLCTITYEEGFSPCTSIHERASTETYTSTVPSIDELYEEPEDLEDPVYDMPEYMPEYRQDYVEAAPQASTPQDFADFFPSQRRMCIRHDDTTSDGNMNLRVDTEVSDGRHKVLLQLFHLRMHDLTRRQFSLRRYARDSGREVCHSSRKYATPASERPGIQRMSSAFASLRLARPEGLKRADSWGSVKSNKSSKSAKSAKSIPRRQDSGYMSDEEEDDDDDNVSFKSAKSGSSSSPVPTNVTKLEFSNYAQVDVKRRGGKGKKRYEFEYWGSSYSWKRVSNKDGSGKRVSYHLIKDDNPTAIAHIVPEMRSPSQERAEEEAGGWVPPCSMWISDAKVLEVNDVADIIVASGLIALVDDCIKQRLSARQKAHRHISVPLTQRSIEYVGPRALVNAMFNRRGSVDSKEREHPSSPLRRQVVAY